MQAQIAVHDRTRLAFGAAGRAGLPGRFEAFDHAGLLVTLTTAPGLEFLNVVAGVSADTVEDLPEILETFRAVGAPPPSLLTLDDTVDTSLRGRGYEPGGQRPLAEVDLATVVAGDLPAGLAVQRIDDDLPLFLDVLGTGYDASPVVRSFMAAEHADDAITRFVVRRHGLPVAVAAMSIHGDVAVLGGAAVLAPARGLGVQRLLLAHRLDAARAAGCRAAAATAAPGSASLTNLRRAGFEIIARRQWQTGQPTISVA